MKNYLIISDSGCDISVEDEKRYGIDIMSFDITLGNEEFRERIDISGEEFIKKLCETEELAKTAQITEFRFREKFDECVEKGIKDVIVVLINGAGSGTYTNAVNAVKNMKEEGKTGQTEFHIFDSHNYSLGYGYAVVEAAKKLEAGQSMDMVLAYLEDWFDCLECYLLLFNLRHARKSGRIKAAAAVMGELMNIKPIIQMIDDDTKTVAKPRGEKKAIEALLDYALSRAVPKTPMIVVRSAVPELEDQLINLIKAKTGSAPSMVGTTGSVVAANAGTRYVGLLIKGEKRR